MMAVVVVVVVVVIFGVMVGVLMMVLLGVVELPWKNAVVNGSHAVEKFT